MQQGARRANRVPWHPSRLLGAVTVSLAIYIASTIYPPRGAAQGLPGELLLNCTADFAAEEQERAEREALQEAIAQPLVGANGEDRSLSAPREANAGAGRRDYVGAGEPDLLILESTRLLARMRRVERLMMLNSSDQHHTGLDVRQHLISDQCALEGLFRCLEVEGGSNEASKCKSCLSDALGQMQLVPACNQTFQTLSRNEVEGSGICGFTAGAVRRSVTTSGVSWILGVGRCLLCVVFLLVLDTYMAARLFALIFKHTLPSRHRYLVVNNPRCTLHHTGCAPTDLPGVPGAAPSRS